MKQTNELRPVSQEEMQRIAASLRNRPIVFQCALCGEGITDRGEQFGLWITSADEEHGQQFWAHKDCVHKALGDTASVLRPELGGPE